MNKVQRKILQGVVDKLSGMNTNYDLAQMSKDEICDALNDAESTVSDILGEEEDKFSNLSEGLQAGPTGEALQNAIDTLSQLNWPIVEDDFKPREDEDDEATTDLADGIQAVIDDIDSIL